MKGFVSLFLLLLGTMPLLWNLLKPGFYTSHDGEWMVIRLTAFHQALREGQFPVRWLPRLNHGYGYPVTNFLYPLPFYLAEPFYVLTGDPATAVQIVMGLSIMAMTTGMYVFLFSLITNHQSLFAAIGALAYVYSPYVAYNLYQRGSLGELVAMGIVPWVFWAIRTHRWPFASLLLAALITAHNVIALLFFPLIALLFLTGPIFSREKIVDTSEPRRRDTTTHGRRPWEWRTYDWGGSLLVISLGLGLSAIFWVPAITELRFVRASTIAVSDFQNEYLSMPEAFRRSGPVATIANLGFPLYFLTDLSKGFWEALKPLQVIQFPWRLLSVLSFTGAVVVALVLFQLKNIKILAICGIFIVFLTFQSSRRFLHPSSFILHPSVYYETNDDTTTVRAEYTPIWVKELPKERPNSPVTHFYPGWRAYLDGKEVALLDPVTTNGVLKSAISSSRVEYKWSETPLRAISNLISIFSSVALLSWEHRRQQKHERHQRRHVRASA